MGDAIGAGSHQRLGPGQLARVFDSLGIDADVELLEAVPGVADVAPRIRFGFSVGTHFFMEIARLRAARQVEDAVAGGDCRASRAALRRADVAAGVIAGV